VSTQWLADHLGSEKLVVLDATVHVVSTPHHGHVSGHEQYILTGHVPGALFADLLETFSDPDGRFPFTKPDRARFEAEAGALGIDNDTTVIVYDAAVGQWASRIWWLFRSWGHNRVAVLDGGIAAWIAAGLPLERSRRTPVSRTMPLRLKPDMALDSDSIDDARLQPGQLLIDARSADRFAGRNESIDLVAGHVPGARNYPFVGNLGADGRFLDPVELRRRWQTLLGSRPPSSVIAMCGSSVTACHNLLALEHAGLPGARLYPGSWSEWIRDPRRPVASGTY